MKKKLTAVIICLLAVILTMSNTLLPVNAEGDDAETSGGTVETVEIKNAADLVTFAERVNAGATTLNAVLENDIDMSEIANFTPIGTSGKTYSGTFDGNGYEVQNLAISSSSNYVGLFGYIKGAAIKNVGVTGTRTIETTLNYAGGIAGYAAPGSTITNCYNTASVSASREDAGGIVGCADLGSTITNCYNTASVSASRDAGGIAGRAFGTITDCYNTASVSASNDYAGGIAGYVASGSSITNCYILQVFQQAMVREE